MRQIIFALKDVEIFSPRVLMAGFSIAFFVTLSPPSQAQETAKSNAVLVNSYGELPLSFAANRGQADRAIRFMAHGSGYSVYLTDSAAVLSLHKDRAPSPSRGQGKKDASDTPLQPDLIQMRLVGAQSGRPATGKEQLPGKANYIIGKNPAKWHTDVPTFAKIGFDEVYPGIDLVYYGRHNQLEYDFIVAPNADPAAIRLQLAGVKRLRLGSDGDLQITATHGGIAFHKPSVYQKIDGKRYEITGTFTVFSHNTVGFTLGRYDHSKNVVIDPVLSYSTYLGGTGVSGATAVAVDQTGSAYLTGLAYREFPTTPGAFQSATKAVSASVPNAFISKLNTAGTALVYSTYLGGSSNSGDAAYGIAVDSVGNAYVTGVANSQDFPVTTGAYQTSCGLLTIFVSKLNPSGTGLSYSTCIGGLVTGTLYGNSPSGIAIDAGGNAYLAGRSAGNYPTTSGSFQPAFADADTQGGFITKLNAAGSQLVYSTFLGGVAGNVGAGKPESVSGVAVDISGNAYVTGLTYGGVPTTSGAFQTASFYGSNYVTNFVTKLNATGSQIIYSTYLGGSTGTSSVYSVSSLSKIRLDSSGNAYMMSSTGATDYPTTSGAFLTTQHASGITGLSTVVSELSSDGSKLLASSYLSGMGGSSGTDLALDSTNNVYLTGVPGTAFPLTSDAIQSVSSGSSFFVAKMSSDLSTLLYSTLLGGNFATAVSAITVDNTNRVYVTGNTAATTYLTTPGSFETSNPQGSGYVGFVSAIAFSGSQPSRTLLTSDGNSQVVGTKTTFTAYVQAISGTIVPSGTVVFAVDGVAGSPVSLDGTGHAAYSLSSLTEGTHTVNAAYAGDMTYAASSSATLTETITGPSATVTAVSGGSQTAPYGSTFGNPLVAIVKDANGNPLSGISITFNGTGLSFSSSAATTGTNGEASVMATATAAGSLSATASTSGVTSTATFSLTAPQVPLTVTAANASVVYNQAIPALTYSITGFADGDTSSALTGTPTETTSATKGSAAGTYPITITQGSLTSSNYSFATFVDSTLTITSLNTAVAPVISPAAGTYTAAQTVTITDATTGATVYYTLDGSTPSASSTKYTGAISVGSSETISASAAASGYTNSEVVIAAYTINIPPPVVATPTFSPAGGTFTSVQAVTIADKTAGAAIYYTVDGSAPTISSTQYTSAISVGSSETINAIAIASGDTNSLVATEAYVINIPAASFTLTASSLSVSVTSGQSGRLTLTVTPENGFISPVAFACSGLPTEATCSFSPTTVTPAGAAVTSSLSITTTASAAVHSLKLWTEGGGSICVALILWPFRRRRRLISIVYVIFLLIAGGAMIGCGGVSSAGKTTSTSYPVTVTAAGGGEMATAPVSLTVTD